MEHSDAIWNDVLEVGTAEKKLKATTQNGAFWRYLKRCFGKWSSLEHFESKEASWCIRTLFQRWFGSWNCLEKCESKEAKWSISTLFEECGPTTFKGVIECGNMFITEITLNNTIRYNVKLLASHCFFLLLQTFAFWTHLHLQTLKYITY